MVDLLVDVDGFGSGGFTVVLELVPLPSASLYVATAYLLIPLGSSYLYGLL